MGFHREPVAVALNRPEPLREVVPMRLDWVQVMMLEVALIELVIYIIDRNKK